MCLHGAPGNAVDWYRVMTSIVSLKWFVGRRLLQGLVCSEYVKNDARARV